MRTCSRCNLDYLDSFMGRGMRCRNCESEMVQEWRSKNRGHYNEHSREYNRKYRYEHPGYTAEKSAMDRLVNPEKTGAYRAVYNAKLPKQPCEVCGAPAEAHHNDYSKPLEVRWLCSLHHKELHKFIKEGVKQNG